MVTIFLAWKTEFIYRFTDSTVNNEFKGLLLGIVLILGISGVVLPWFYHSRWFEKNVF